jgi:hypothetical protein
MPGHLQYPRYYRVSARKRERQRAGINNSIVYFSLAGK